MNYWLETYKEWLLLSAIVISFAFAIATIVAVITNTTEYWFHPITLGVIFIFVIIMIVLYPCWILRTSLKYG
jgi:hypothetical protein